MTNIKFSKTTLLHAIESTSSSGFQKQYPHPFLTPSLYSPHPLSKERWGYSKRGVRDWDIASEGPMPKMNRWHDEK